MLKQFLSPVRAAIARVIEHPIVNIGIAILVWRVGDRLLFENLEAALDMVTKPDKRMMVMADEFLGNLEELRARCEEAGAIVMRKDLRIQELEQALLNVDRILHDPAIEDQISAISHVMTPFCEGSDQYDHKGAPGCGT